MYQNRSFFARQFRILNEQNLRKKFKKKRSQVLQWAEHPPKLVSLKNIEIVKYKKKRKCQVKKRKTVGHLPPPLIRDVGEKSVISFFSNPPGFNKGNSKMKACLYETLYDDQANMLDVYFPSNQRKNDLFSLKKKTKKHQHHFNYCHNSGGYKKRDTIVTQLPR